MDRNDLISINQEDNRSSTSSFHGEAKCETITTRLRTFIMMRY